MENSIPDAVPLSPESVGTDPSTTSQEDLRPEMRTTSEEDAKVDKNAGVVPPLEPNFEDNLNERYEKEKTMLRIQLERELQELTIPELIEQLRAVRNAKEVPRAVVVKHREDDEETYSIVSNLTTPDEIASLATNDSSMPLSKSSSDPRALGNPNRLPAKTRVRQLKRRDRVSIRRFPPLPPPKDATKDPSKAEGISVCIEIHDRPMQGLYSGRVDNLGRPSGTGVIKFEDNNDLYDLYIGKFFLIIPMRGSFPTTPHIDFIHYMAMLIMLSSGEFLEGRIHGRGTFIFHNETGGDASVLKGDFENNMFVV